MIRYLVATDGNVHYRGDQLLPEAARGDLGAPHSPRAAVPDLRCLDVCAPRLATSERGRSPMRRRSTR